MNAQENTLNKIAELQGVRDLRARNLERTVNKILDHKEAIVRLEAQAANWEMGIDSAEAALEELTAELEEYPLDMSPTGEDEPTEEDWEAAGFTVQ